MVGPANKAGHHRPVRAGKLDLLMNTKLSLGIVVLGVESNLYRQPNSCPGSYLYAVAVV